MESQDGRLALEAVDLLNQQKRENGKVLCSTLTIRSSGFGLCVVCVKALFPAFGSQLLKKEDPDEHVQSNKTETSEITAYAVFEDQKMHRPGKSDNVRKWPLMKRPNPKLDTDPK